MICWNTVNVLVYRYKETEMKIDETRIFATCRDSPYFESQLFDNIFRYSRIALSDEKYMNYASALSDFGWKVEDWFNNYMQIFKEFDTISSKPNSDIVVFDDFCIDNLETRDAWLIEQGDDILPFGYNSTEILFIDRSGRIYGDLRDQGLMLIYGDNICESIKNLLNLQSKKIVKIDIDKYIQD